MGFLSTAVSATNPLTAPVAPGTTTGAPVVATPTTATAGQTQVQPTDGAVRVDAQGNLYTYYAAAGGFVPNVAAAQAQQASGGTGKLTPADFAAAGQQVGAADLSKLSPIPNGFQTTGPMGQALTYDASTGQFTGAGLGGDATASPSAISGVNQASGGSLDAAVKTIVSNPAGILTGGAVGGGPLDALGGLGGLGAGSIDTSAIAKAAATSGATGADLLNRGANYVGGTAQQNTPAQAQAAIAAQGSPIIAGGYSGTTLAPAAQAATQAAIAAEQVKAAQAGGVQLAPAALAGNTTLAPASTAMGSTLAPTAQAAAAQLNLANANQTRGQQEGLIGSLQDTIAGKTPSVAEMALRNATDNNVANQYALAQAAPGMNTGLANRTAMINAAQINQQAIYQQALLRAQEVQQAQGQLSSNLSTVAGQDVSTAGTNAQLQQQVALANQSATNTGAQAQLSADVQTKLANAGFLNTASMNQAQLNQAIQLANAGFKNTASTTQAQLDQATQQLNTTQANSIAQGNQSANLAAQTTNATLGNQVNLANAAAQNSQSQAQGQLTNAAGINNANNLTSANTASANLANQVALANAQNQTAVSTSNANQANTVNQANQTADLNQQQINNTAVNNLNTAGVTSQGQAITGTVGAAQAQAQAEAAKAAELGAVATAGASLLKSDVRAKTNITKSEKEISQFVKSFDPYAFDYKNPTKPGTAKGRRYGILAQELERSKVGRSLVEEDEDGDKVINVPQAVGAILATISAQNKRLERAGLN